ncbi:MAG: aminoglycoside phosphotransferase family protein [Candidatus Viridilinea halotolerans]|uniref:Aminoglycoside phosphotransferase family protein n=1 Tax=Candidatus Viridilinea halotolerans TaxID=2491704 RepID=A0A426TVT1_9CHLR|nr:MAG: aminoglycoside phosphotransferase family protein [Candidatus Viridilinea halotolerans]
MNYSALNHYVPPVAEGVSDAWRHALGRLGDYTSVVVRATNLRPSGVVLYAQTEQHLLVRISTPGEHVMLRIAPEDDLAAHVCFLRMMNGQGLPSARIIQRDLSCTLVPFAYALESYVPGVAATTLGSDPLLRGAGRQAGRNLRRMHRTTLPGAGRPMRSGRWHARSWVVALRQIGAIMAAPPTDALLFGEAERATLLALLADSRLAISQPVLMHGAFGPEAVRCTAGLHIHLEALVEPGYCVSGDGLFDLACGMAAVYPAAWREGLLEGYQGAAPLSEAEQARLPILRLLANAWIACHRYSRAQPHAAAHEEALRMLEQV